MAKTTLNFSLPLNTLGSSNFKASFRKAMTIIEVERGITLPKDTTGHLVFQRSFRVAMNAIAANLGITIPVATFGYVAMRRSFVRAMFLIDAAMEVPTPTNMQLVANFTGISNGAAAAMTATYTGNPGRLGHKMGRVGARNIRIRDDAVRIVSGSGTENISAPANNTTFERALERLVETTRTTTRALYAGANSAVLAPGGSILSDIVVPRLEADENFWTRFYRTVPDPANDQLLAMDNAGPDQQGFRTAGASQLLNTGSLNASGTGGGPSHFPTGIYGIPDVPLAAVTLVGDSIANRQNGTNTAATGGAWAQALNNVDGHAVPFCRQTVGGNTMNAQSSANAPKQKQVWGYTTDVMIALGTNDLGSLNSGTQAERLASMQARFTELATTARSIIGPYGNRLRVHAFSVLRRSSFDATQEAVRVAFNAWLAAGAGGLVDKYYDLATVAGDPATWATDGTHPPQAVHDAMALVIAEGFRPFVNPYYLF
jgi:lysophospholipase L1-like esterase